MCDILRNWRLHLPGPHLKWAKTMQTFINERMIWPFDFIIYPKQNKKRNRNRLTTWCPDRWMPVRLVFRAVVRRLPCTLVPALRPHLTVHTGRVFDRRPAACAEYHLCEKNKQKQTRNTHTHSIDWLIAMLYFILRLWNQIKVITEIVFTCPYAIYRMVVENSVQSFDAYQCQRLRPPIRWPRTAHITKETLSPVHLSSWLNRKERIICHVNSQHNKQSQTIAQPFSTFLFRNSQRFVFSLNQQTN